MLKSCTKTSGKTISLILVQVFLCTSLVHPAENLRVPMGSWKQEAKKMIDAKTMKLNLAVIITGVIGKSIELLQMLEQLSPEGLHQAWVRRLNFESEFFKSLFREQWSADPKHLSAIDLLTNGYNTQHKLDRDTGRLYLDFGQLREEFKEQIPETLGGYKIYGNTDHKNRLVALEWAYFPDLALWLPVQVSVFKEGKLAVTPAKIKTAIKEDGKVLGVGAQFGRKQLAKLFKKSGPYLFCMRASPTGPITVGSESLRKKGSKKFRTRNSYSFTEWHDHLVQAKIGQGGVAVALQCIGLGENMELKIIETRTRDGNAVKIDNVESHVDLDDGTMRILTKEFGEFWISGLQLKTTSQTADECSFRVGSRQFYGELFVDEPWMRKYLATETDAKISTGKDRHPAYTMRVGYVFLSSLAESGKNAEVLMVDGVPAYLQIIDEDQGHVIKRLELRPKKGGILQEAIDACYREVSESSLLGALAHAAQNESNVAVTRLNTRRTSGEDAGSLRVSVGGKRIYVPVGLINSIPKELSEKIESAEVIYDPLKVIHNSQTGQAMPVPIEVHLGYYSDPADDPYRLAEAKFIQVASFRLMQDAQSSQHFNAIVLSKDAEEAEILEARRQDIAKELDVLDALKKDMAEKMAKEKNMTAEQYGRRGDPARKQKQEMANLASDIVKYGTMQDAERYLGHFTPDMEDSNASQLAIAFFASAVGERGNAEHLRLIEGLLPVLSVCAIDSEEAGDALRFATHAFASKGDEQFLEGLKGLLEKLVPHVSIFEMQDAITGIGEAIARYGTADDVRFLLGCFIRGTDAKTANYIIYRFAIDIEMYGSREQLSALLELDSWANGESYSFAGIADAVPAIGLACLAKGNEEDVANYARLFIEPLSEKKAGIICNLMSRSIAEHESLIPLINPYIAKMAPNLNDEKRETALIAIAGLVVKEGGPEHVKEYLEVFIPTLTDLRSQGAVRMLEYFINTYGNAEQMEQRKRAIALKELLDMQDEEDFIVDGQVFSKQDAIQLVAAGDLIWGDGQWKSTHPVLQEAILEETQVALEGQPLLEDEPPVITPVPASVNLIEPPLVRAPSLKALRRGNIGIKAIDLQNTAVYSNAMAMNKGRPLIALKISQQKEFKRIPKNDYVAVEFQIESADKKCFSYVVVIDHKKDVQHLFTGENITGFNPHENEFVCKLDVYRNYVYLDLFAPLLRREELEGIFRAIEASLSRNFPGMRIRMVTDDPEEVKGLEHGFNARLTRLTVSDYREKYTEEDRTKIRVRRFSYNPDTKPGSLTSDINLLVNELVEIGILNNSDRQYIEQEVGKTRGAKIRADNFHKALIERLSQKGNLHQMSPLQYLGYRFHRELVSDFANFSFIGSLAIEGIIPSSAVTITPLASKTREAL